MSPVDPVGAAPETRQRSFLWLLFGASAAPIFWMGQLLAGYAVTVYACYPGYAPLAAGPRPLFTALIAFDAIAVAAALAGGAISLSAFLRTRESPNTGFGEISPVEQRTRFLALWGTMSSLWFFFAILFNTLASVMAPLCGE